MKSFRLYFSLLFLALSYTLASQTPSFNFQKLGSEEGLNNANIFNIEQHTNGLTYFTTQNGIYYYNGYKFEKLIIDSLKSNALLNVAIEDAGRLYLSIRGEGIYSYSFESRQLSVLPHLRLKNNNADNFVVTPAFAYLLTSGIKLVTVDLKTGKEVPDALTEADRLNRPFCIYRTRKGRLIIGRSDGLYELRGAQQIRLPALKGSEVHAITETQDGDLVAGASGKIFVLRGDKVSREITPAYKTKNFTFQLGGEKTIDKVVADDYGRIWFTSYPDENLYLYENNTVYDLFAILDIPPTLVNCVFKDRQQNIWIGTYNDGVYYIQNSFYNTVNFSFNNNNLNVNQVYLKDHLLVAATSNGLYGLNLKTNQTKVLSRPDEVLMDPINNITESNGVIYYSKGSQFDMTPSSFADGKGTYLFKPVAARLFYPVNNNQSIIVDYQSDVLLCNRDATWVLDTLISFLDYRIVVNAFLKCQDSLYIATNNGLFIYNFKKHACRNLVSPALNFNINDLAILNGKIYAAHEAGITEVSDARLIQQAGPFRLNSVRKIRQHDKQIWLATLDGVFICDQAFEPIKILNKANGLLSNSINDIAFADHTVSIATARGIATADLEAIRQYSARLRPVSIETVMWKEVEVPVRNGAVYLQSDQTDITIYFSSPFFDKPNRQFFKYRLDGSEWKHIEGFSFSLQLAGGSHLIEISASADNITWSDNSLLKIVKEEKLSERRAIYWLITLGAILLVSGISFVWIRQVKTKAKKRLQEEQQVNLLKHQAMNSLLSPHFIFNSLTSIQNYINTNNSLKASEYLAKFSRLIRMIIEKASQSNISLYDELTRLTYYLELEKERFKNKFDYEIHIDDGINTHEVLIPNMIIQPHVENCIIHGILPKQTHGTLSISFKKQEGDKILILIEDDGIGLIKAAEHAKTGHKSLGTSTIKNILEINSKLTGKMQRVKMVDKSTLDPESSGTLISIELDQ